MKCKTMKDKVQAYITKYYRKVKKIQYLGYLQKVIKMIENITQHIMPRKKYC